MATVTFPFKPQHAACRLGKIVEITGIAHTIDRPQMGYSRDYWYYLGQVEWSDTGKTSEPNRHIYPYDLWADTPEGFSEINDLSETMMGYLHEHGEWRKTKPEGWYANKRK